MFAALYAIISRRELINEWQWIDERLFLADAIERMAGTSRSGGFGHHGKRNFVSERRQQGLSAVG